MMETVWVKLQHRQELYVKEVQRVPRMADTINLTVESRKIRARVECVQWALREPGQQPVTPIVHCVQIAETEPDGQ